MKLFKKIFWTLIWSGAIIFWTIDLANLFKGIIPDKLSIILVFIIAICSMLKSLLEEWCE